MLAFALLFAAVATVPDYAAFDRVLQKYVLENGKVRYAAMKGDADLDRFVAQIAEVSPDSHPELFPTTNAKLAYWINAYNALVLKAFSKDYPGKRERLGSTVGRFSFFYRQKHTVGKTSRTLDDIEVNSIRKPFHDPRIHFAIVCASASCPYLSNHVYTPENVDAKLTEEAKRYWAQSRNFSIDRTSRTLTVPAILDWFKEDFGGSPDKIVAFIAKYRPAESADLASGSWNLKYFPYDWSPNDTN